MQLIRAAAIVATCALAVAACARAQKGSKEPTSILQASGDSVRVQLLDAAAAKPLANADVELWPDNGIRCPHPIKLLDARTHDPIANKPVLIEIRGAAAHDVASVTSNSLGYVLVPFVILAKGAESSWVVVDGYRDGKIDFAATRRTLRLQPL
ncbi:MAG TPA: hypothetical protein VGO46_06795 [Gemmatimonadaceae bacterium]|nr:hypothetical protein [Gemmatimonadaceae bacterium]